jgi:hypothetical protein
MIPGKWVGEQPTGYIIPRSAEPPANLKRQNIAPLLAYTRAWHDINASGRLRQMWRQVLVDAGLISPKGGRLPKRFELGNIDY